MPLMLQPVVDLKAITVRQRVEKSRPLPQHDGDALTCFAPPPDDRLDLLGRVAGQPAVLSMELTAVAPQLDWQHLRSPSQQANQSARLGVVEVIKI